MNQAVQHLGRNITAARKARRWTLAQFAAELALRGTTVTERQVEELERGDREPGLTEAMAVAETFTTTVDAMMTSPDDFQRTLEWTGRRNAYIEARKHLMQAAANYESAAEELRDYMEGDLQIPQIERDELERQLAQSCAWVAMDGYRERDPWRERWGVQVAADDPVARLRP
ncbi:MAG: helix-turn-helix domain-containing protein [Acidipropionibacterium acidipropionici]|nr:helix-turn-helix domain-containing protein [Acidipropionibacterium acidipropionici]